jgi:predicted nucleotidyltransferase
MTQEQYGLPEALLKQLRNIFIHYAHIDKVLLFGSRVKGSFREGSDIDLAVLGSKITKEEFTQIWGQVDLLAVMLKIDLLHWDKLENLVLKNKIINEGKAIYPACISL